MGTEQLLVLGSAADGYVLEKWISSKPRGSVQARILNTWSTDLYLVGPIYLTPESRPALTYARREVFRNPPYGTPLAVAVGIPASHALVLYAVSGPAGAVELRMTSLADGLSALYASSVSTAALAEKDYVQTFALKTGEAIHACWDMDSSGPAGEVCVLVDSDRDGDMDFNVEFMTEVEFNASAFMDPALVAEDFITFPDGL